jgi:hypothetical protein
LFWFYVAVLNGISIWVIVNGAAAILTVMNLGVILLNLNLPTTIYVLIGFACSNN